MREDILQDETLRRRAGIIESLYRDGMKAAEAAIDRGLDRAKADDVPHSPPLWIA